MDQPRQTGWIGFGIPLVAGLFLFVYYPTFAKLIAYWSSNDMYSHGFAVPFIAAALIWIRRHDLGQISASPSFSVGLLVLVGGLSMLVAGRLSNTNLLEELSVFVTICGLVLLLFGLTVFRRVLFPLSCLLFMIPFWEFLTSRIHPYFQFYSAAIGVASLRMFGIPVFRDGALIGLPNITLEVAEACSGVNHLIAVVCIGVPLTYLYINAWSRRVVVISSAALIALLSNGLRVAMVSFFAYYEIRGANGDIHGPMALFRSFLVSGIGFLALFALIWRLADKDPPLHSMWSTGGESSSGIATYPRPRLAPVLLAVALIGSVAVMVQFHDVVAVPMDPSLRAMPDRLGRWVSRPPAPPPIDLGSVKFDDVLSRSYASSDGTEVTLLLGYFRDQEQGRELAGSSLRRSLTGERHHSYVVPSGHGVRVNDLLITAANKALYVTYWYQLNGRILSEDYQVKLHTAWSALVRGETNGAFILIATPARGQEPLEVARHRVQDFVTGMIAASTVQLAD